MPSLRIDQSDLKCKNGCDYFGNPQWQGYCSECHRKQLQRQRRAEKASSSTLPKPEAKKQERAIKLTSHSSFSKFEEKRLKQSETLKKANLLKFSVFKKSSSDEQEQVAERRPPEFRVPEAVNQSMKREFRERFPGLAAAVDRDARLFVHSFIMDVMRCSSVMSVDELSERVQRQYQRFIKYMDTSAHFDHVEPETKEQLIDFVEKHAMTFLHDLPGVVFSPAGTEDERADRAMSERIQQLGWLSERHLDCKVDRACPYSRSLLYKAISEVLGMDSAPHPGGKLHRVRRACRHVLAMCGAPASADDLLPALILTVLKANPPRLVSNINFVTRFCNAQRLMTGEGGYYFTNLCCAVSFIENLTAESLSMDKKEFDCYMAMPASIGGSTWAATLSLCGATREAAEQRERAAGLLAGLGEITARADQLAHGAETFETEITKKVQDVLSKTPLKINPRREIPRLGTRKTSTASLIDLETPVDQPGPKAVPEIHVPVSEATEEAAVDLQFEDPNEIGYIQVSDKGTPSNSAQSQAWDIKQSSSFELLTPSPLGFTPFQSRSIDELVTPDDFGSENLAPGLGNINYDIDLSDLSGDNSLAEDAPKPKDPFSPEGLKKEPVFDPFAPHTSQVLSAVLDKFDEFSLVNRETKQASESFEIVHRVDEFDPMRQPCDPFSPEQRGESLLDEGESPGAACLLPSPLQPQGRSG